MLFILVCYLSMICVILYWKYRITSDFTLLTCCKLQYQPYPLSVVAARIRTHANSSDETKMFSNWCQDFCSVNNSMDSRNEILEEVNTILKTLQTIVYKLSMSQSDKDVSFSQDILPAQQTLTNKLFMGMYGVLLANSTSSMQDFQEREDFIPQRHQTRGKRRREDCASIFQLIIYLLICCTYLSALSSIFRVILY